MGLRAQAAVDAKAILEDSASGFGWPLTLTSPAGVATLLTGFATDVSESVDPETGVIVSGRQAAVTLSFLSLAAASVEMPTGVAEKGRRPWIVTFADVMLAALTWKVVEVLPDRALGVVRLILEGYRAGTD